MKPFFALTLLAAAIFGTTVRAQDSVSCSELLHGVLTKPKFDTSVELELGVTMNSRVLEILTTPDGKVGSYLSASSPHAPNSGVALDPPGWLVDLVKKEHPQIVNPADLPFDSLTRRQKFDLIRYVARQRQAVDYFFEDRVMHGLRIKPNLELEFDETTTFLGKTYRKGKHNIDVSETVGKVEYRSVGDAEATDGFQIGIELHFRADESSGTVSNDAWKFLDGLRIARTHQHVHSVARVPLKKLKEKPGIRAAVMGDFYRRVNLASEMLAIDSGQGIAMVANEESVFFSYLSRESLGEVVGYFKSRAQGANPRLRTLLKEGYAGFRGSDFYDQRNLYGIEHRYIPKTYDPAQTKSFLDSVQAAMQRETFWRMEDRMERFLAQFREPGAPPYYYFESNVIGETLYHNPWDKMTEAPGFVRSLRRDYNKLVAGLPEQLRSDHDEIKMLLHDWARDPLFFEDASMQERIRSAQRDGIRKILALRNPQSRDINAIMREFLHGSGLFEAMIRSID